ncbi:MAG TPA: VWA domain-containing protein [Terracidiphilus sp.]|jgi:VWFA-related protein|nr:VWA domain-containing protein [Terracidiphilus sp.]
MYARIPLAAFLLALPGVPAALGQLAPSPDAPPVSTAPATTPDQQPVATFHVNVNLVDVIFTVKDKNGALVPHLTKNDCTVDEDKVPQTLKTFVAESNQPLTLGILLDTSGSQQRVLPLEQQAGSEFLERVLRAKDEAFVLSFDVNVDLLQDYTNSAHMLARALDKAEINTAGGNGSGIPGLGGGTVPTVGDPKGTLLYDAIYLASTEKLVQQTGRKALIILTDGEDEGSNTKIADAIAAAQRSNVIVYVILIADRGMYWSQGMAYTGYSAAKKIADETGGRVIDVGNNGPKLEAAFEQIEDELRTQYVASYTPTNTKLDGTFRHLAVQCGEGMKVQVRKGYYATPPQDAME